MERRFLGIVAMAILFFWPQAAETAKRNLTVSLDKREIRDLTSQGLLLVFFLKVANLTPSPYYLEQVDYRVVIREKDYFSLKTKLEEPIPVPAIGETSISLPVKILYSLLEETAVQIEEESRLSSYVTGLMMFSDGRRIKEKIPFAFAGDFPIFRDLDVDIHPLQVKSISLGGAEFILAFTWKNPNPFDLDLDRSTYRLQLGRKEVAQGLIRGGDRIESRGEKTFSLSLILDFFETGRELQTVFEQPAAECGLVLELEASTVWGPLKFGLSKKQVVAVEKKNDGLHHHSHL